MSPADISTGLFYFYAYCKYEKTVFTLSFKVLLVSKDSLNNKPNESH